MSPPRYQPLSQRDINVDIEQVKPENQADPYDGEFSDKQTGRNTFTWKQLLILILSMAALVQGSYLLTKPFAASKYALRGGARTRLGTPCRGSGKYRNYTSGASELPTHFTLPSGDKIPAVALGTAARSVSISERSGTLTEGWT